MVQVRTVACHFVNIVQRYCMLYQYIAACWYMVIGWIWHRNISDIRQKWIGSKNYTGLWSNDTDNGYAIWANQNQHCAIHHYGSGTASLHWSVLIKVHKYIYPAVCKKCYLCTTVCFYVYIWGYMYLMMASYWPWCKVTPVLLPMIHGESAVFFSAVLVQALLF